MAVPLDAIAMGEALWDLSAPRGRTFSEATSLLLSPGGAAVNVALALLGRGHRTGLAAVVGSDALGDALVNRVAARGVSTALVQRAPPRTGLVFVDRAEGSPKVVSYRATDEAVPDLPRGWQARLLVLTGLLPSEAQAASFGAAARSARRQGARVVVDLNARLRPWRGRSTQQPPAWLREADVIKASEEDLAAMGLREARLREGLRASAVLVVTAGPEGSRAVGPFGALRCSPKTSLGGSAVGAGDAFVAGVCDALLREHGAEDRAFWEKALRMGNALGRQKARSASRRWGGSPSQALPTK